MRRCWILDFALWTGDAEASWRARASLGLQSKIQNPKSKILLGLLGVLCGVALLGYAAPQGPNEQINPKLPQWDTRLEALKPSEPLAYFELAEEIADAAGESIERDLAKHLFALAGVLDPDRLGRSACLALADLEENQTEKRRLMALASLLQASSDAGIGGGQAWQASTQNQLESPGAALAVAEALSHYRQGEGPKAQNALRKAGSAAMELLKAHDRVIPGGATRFLEDLKLYKGQTKPTLSSIDITRMLQLEAALLTGVERTWSAELLLTGGQPLIEVDPARLADSLGVNATRPFYRKGRWAER